MTNPEIPAPRPTPDLELERAVWEDDVMIEAVRTGARGTDDPDPLVRLLAAWRVARRLPRRRSRGPRCAGVRRP